MYETVDVLFRQVNRYVGFAGVVREGSATGLFGNFYAMPLIEDQARASVIDVVVEDVHYAAGEKLNVFRILDC